MLNTIMVYTKKYLIHISFNKIICKYKYILNTISLFVNIKFQIIYFFKSELFLNQKHDK